MERRSRICIAIILIGLANFLAYSVIYLVIDGEAIHGNIVRDEEGKYWHYLRSPTAHDIPVSRGVYIYSGVHSISIWVTVGAVMLSMLTLAKERIVSAMHSTVVRGRTLITILATVIAMTTTLIALWFVLQFARRFAEPSPPGPTPPPATRPAGTRPA